MSRINVSFGDFTTDRLPFGWIEIRKPNDAAQQETGWVDADWQGFTVTPHLGHMDAFLGEYYKSFNDQPWSSVNPQHENQIRILSHLIDMAIEDIDAYQFPIDLPADEIVRHTRWHRLQRDCARGAQVILGRWLVQVNMLRAFAKADAIPDEPAQVVPDLAPAA